MSDASKDMVVDLVQRFDTAVDALRHIVSLVEEGWKDKADTDYRSLYNSAKSALEELGEDFPS